MLNRFTKLPTANIRSSQVLTDLGIVDSALQRQQKSYDETATRTAATVQAADNLDFVGDAANNYKTKLTEDLKARVGEWSNLDLADPTVKSQVNGYIQNLSSDPELKKHAQAKQLYDEHQNQLQELAKKGKVHSSQQLLQDLAWKKYSETGEVTEDLKQPLYEAQNLVKARGELVDMIKSSGHEGTAFFKDFAYGKSSSGVSMDKISGAVKEQLSTYANSQAGIQEYNDYKVGVMSGSIPKGKSFDKYLLEQVMSTAKNYAHSNSSDNFAGAYNAAKKKEEVDAYAGEGYMPAMGGKDVEIDSDGNINVNPIMDLVQMVSGYEPRNAEELALQKTIQSGAKKANMSAQQFAERLNSDPNVKLSYYNTKKASDISKKFFNPSTGGGDFWTRIVYSQEFPQGISAKEYMKEKDLSEEDLKKGFTVIGDVDADNPYTSKGMATMIGGEPVVIDDRTSNKLNTKAGQLSEFNHLKSQAKYNGTGLTKFQLGGVEFEYRFDGENLIQESAKEL